MVSKRSDGFAARESGAATFDWVILAVGVFGLGLAVVSVFTAELDDRADAPQPVIERSASRSPDAPLYPYFDEAWRQDQMSYYADMDDTALLAQPSPDDIAALGATGFVRDAIETLVGVEGDVAHPDHGDASRALQILYLEQRGLQK